MILVHFWFRVIRHNAPVSPNFGHVDKFRIQIYESLNSSSSNQSVGALLGKKTIEAVLLEKRIHATGNQGQEENVLDEDGDGEFSQFPSNPSSSASFSSSGRLKNTSGPVPMQWQPTRRAVMFPSPGQHGKFAIDSVVVQQTTISFKSHLP